MHSAADDLVWSVHAGSFDRFLNVQICLIILLQIVMCAVHGSIALGWRNRYGVQHYYLALDVTGQVQWLSQGIQIELLRYPPIRNAESGM